MPAPGPVVYGILPNAARIPHCLVGGFRNVHGHQLPRPQQPRQLERIPPVGLDPVPRPGRRQRRGHHDARVPQRQQAAGGDKPAGPRLVGETKHHLPAGLCTGSKRRTTAVGNPDQPRWAHST